MSARYVLSLLLTLSAGELLSQGDTTRVLEEVVVAAYASQRDVLEVPASIGVLGSTALNRFSNTSFVPTVNTVPGVRMEERSPGSYRFSIRGSLLRSPFGVRNVKFYWNGLPLTDGGGNTYLNLLDFDAVGTMEIIKGPGASLYGAGTGGVVLMNSPVLQPTNSLRLSVLGGSYGLFRAQAGATVHTGSQSKLALRFSGQRADGYREQTQMHRLSTGMDWEYRITPSDLLTVTALASSLVYGTPGGLTGQQFVENPRQARPATATLPGASDAKAAVTNNTLYTATRMEHVWNNAWTTTAGIFLSLTQFENPTIRNYEERGETNWGGRIETEYTWKGKIGGKFTFGGEYQRFFSPLSVYQNNAGEKGTLQEQDELKTAGGLLFAQTTFELPARFLLTTGASLNFLKYDLLRTSVSPTIAQQRTFDPQIFPRIALLNKVTENMSLFASVSEGFSPPSLAEVRPSTGAFNNTLQPERGLNYEAGWRGRLAGVFTFDVARYHFRLRDAIVIQRNAEGAEFFVNAGGTRQNGWEATLTFSPETGNSIVSDLDFVVSGAYNRFTFDDYVQDGNDFSGNKLTGVAPGFVAVQADVRLRQGWYLLPTLHYSDHTPLNDANTAYASAHWLLGGRVGYQTKRSRWPLDFFAGIDNALDEVYSLGNDLNAIGGRYYNAAPGRNFYVGITFNTAGKP